MAWIVTEGNEYADVHSNSGEFTYGGNDSLCGGIPENTCDPYTNYTVKAELEESNNFDDFISDCGKISKTITAKSCNQDMLVMWFNDADLYNIRVGNQKFEDSSYTDSGYPCISTDPCDSSSECKYVSGTTYQGHKIKYHTINDTIPANFYVNHDELVELYFPHMYNSTDEGMNTKIIGEHAFSSCHRLSAITFSAVERIENNAFKDCYYLRSIDWGHVGCCDSYLKTIGDYAFRNIICYINLCLDKLKNIETIGVGAFSNENQQCIFKNLTLPTSKKYTEVSTYCFMNSHVMFSEIPPNIKKIGEGAFYGHCCQEIKIPKTVTEIGKQAFEANSQDIRVHNTTCSGSVFRVSTTFDLSEWEVADYNNATIAEKALGDVTVQGIIDKILVKSEAVEAFKSKFGNEYAPYIEEA